MEYTTTSEINLHTIINIEQNVVKPFLDHTGHTELSLTFKPAKYDNADKLVEQSVFFEERPNHSTDTTPDTYYSGYNCIKSIDPDAVNGNIMTRIIKALYYLVELDGGKPIKDIF